MSCTKIFAGISAWNYHQVGQHAKSCANKRDLRKTVVVEDHLTQHLKKTKSITVAGKVVEMIPSNQDTILGWRCPIPMCRHFFALGGGIGDFQMEKHCNVHIKKTEPLGKQQSMLSFTKQMSISPSLISPNEVSSRPVLKVSSSPEICIFEPRKSRHQIINDFINLSNSNYGLCQGHKLKINPPIHLNYAFGNHENSLCFWTYPNEQGIIHHVNCTHIIDFVPVDASERLSTTSSSPSSPSTIKLACTLCYNLKDSIEVKKIESRAADVDVHSSHIVNRYFTLNLFVLDLLLNVQFFL